MWWIILRFMGDLPEPKKLSQERLNTLNSPFPQYSLRQGRRLSNLVGLDQVLTS